MLNEHCAIPCKTCQPAPAGAEGFGLNPLNPDYPFNNLSAERPDIDLFISVRPSGLGLPPLGSTWYAVGCLGFCFSNESQADADICAANQAALCVSGEWPIIIPNPLLPILPDEPPFIPQNRPLFYNSAQSCDFNCPDGALFSYTVPAGTFAALNQPTADAWAHSLACIKAAQNYICISNLPTTGLCLDSAYNFVINISATNKPVSASISAGSLPTGMTMTMGANPVAPTVIISGNPTTAGAYMFTLLVIDSFGNTSTKSYSLNVVGIVDSGQLPDATLGDPYLFGLTVAGVFAGPVTFSVFSGDLPDGLSLQPVTGEIIGTPTDSAFFEFVILVTDGVVSCTKALSMNVAEGSDCPDWDNMPWHDFLNFDSGLGVSSMTPNGVGPTGSFICSAQVFSNTDSCGVQNNGLIAQYSGPACNCNLHLVVTSLVGVTSDASLAIFTGAPLFGTPLLVSPLALGLGTFDIPFVIPDGTVTPFDIGVVITDTPGGPGALLMEFSGNITSIP